MPLQGAHIMQAKHNAQCANTFIKANEDDLRDWAITAAFYAAVHYTEACFAELPNIKHTERVAPGEKHKYRLETLQSLAPIAHVDYEILYRASSLVRYLNFGARDEKPPANRYYTAEVVHGFVEDLLPRLRIELERVFQPQTPLA